MRERDARKQATTIVRGLGLSGSDNPEEGQEGKTETKLVHLEDQTVIEDTDMFDSRRGLDEDNTSTQPQPDSSTPRSPREVVPPVVSPVDRILGFFKFGNFPFGISNTDERKVEMAPLTSNMEQRDSNDTKSDSGRNRTTGLIKSPSWMEDDDDEADSISIKVGQRSQNSEKSPVQNEGRMKPFFEGDKKGNNKNPNIKKNKKKKSEWEDSDDDDEFITRRDYADAF